MYLHETAATRGDVFAQYGLNIAKALLTQQSANKAERLSALGGFAASATRTIPDHQCPRFDTQCAHDDAVPVGILGGGMAGLYAGLMLAYAGIPFQILEATDRIGGRCYTYKFDEGGDWDYYDVGAMRFPLPKDHKVGPHKRLQELFDLLNIDTLKYTYKEDEGLMHFNGVASTIGDTEQRFRANELQIPDCYIQAGVKAICDDYINPLAELLLKDMETGGNEGWEKLKNEFDHYSTRSYLQFGYKPSRALQEKFGIPNTGLPTSVINWLETFDKSSGWYDRALTETVLEQIAFGAVGPEVDWRCIRYGTSVLPETALKKIEEWAKNIPDMPSKIMVMESPVTSIVPSDPSDKKSPLVVRTADGKEYRYSHVISTVPLPNFAMINTSQLDISTMQRNAIRQLQYGPSIKIGMLFKYPWWKDYKQVGGQSFTDLPVRTICYPSYGSEQESNVLIASYCWTNDAEKLGNLIGAGVDSLLDELVFENLATVHGVDVKFIREQHVRTYSWNWNHNAWSGGAFAFFGPGQYEYLYGALNGTAADGRLQWAGELLSVRHAWIVGALDSAWAAVMKYHHISNRSHDLEAFYTQWGKNLEWFGHSALTENNDTKSKRRNGGGYGGGASRHSKRSEIPDEDEMEAGKEGKTDGPEPTHVPRNDHNLLLSYMILQNPDLVEFIDY
ncbi:FAD/NAD(P)-binding domain-containing protein [Coprinellus micaceus]|uniref:FAD/NAD(P)-binding domain-containing protein n=1 Tax=Coprinellus micaceus TaxID=71717 RepID=A0A4Y7SAI1_COPMI|nr:FAD/NAD(P)-binding domain-containing protein [Coprinellus micaceus]